MSFIPEYPVGPKPSGCLVEKVKYLSMKSSGPIASLSALNNG
jgi:hypothetical protein